MQHIKKEKQKEVIKKKKINKARVFFFLFSLCLYPDAGDKGIKRLTLKRNKVPKKGAGETGREKEGTGGWGGRHFSAVIVAAINKSSGGAQRRSAAALR